MDKNNTYYNIQSSLTSQGINVFDINDPFYTDICYDFDNKLKKDIPLNDRMQTFFQMQHYVIQDVNMKVLI